MPSRRIGCSASPHGRRPHNRRLPLIDLCDLKPGDILGYRGTGPVSWVIRFRTLGSPLNHVETYLGGARTAAARWHEGVGTFPLTLEGLSCVLRPVEPFDFLAGLKWHRSVIGQKYDTWGLLRVFYCGKSGAANGQYCSEHAARFTKQEGLSLFGTTFDCDRAYPGLFLATPLLAVVWAAHPL